MYNLLYSGQSMWYALLKMLCEIEECGNTYICIWYVILLTEIVRTIFINTVNTHVLSHICIYYVFHENYTLSHQSIVHSKSNTTLSLMWAVLNLQTLSTESQTHVAKAHSYIAFKSRRYVTNMPGPWREETTI